MLLLMRGMPSPITPNPLACLCVMILYLGYVLVVHTNVCP